MAELLRQVRYKADWYQRTLCVVPKEFPSSQLCSACGHLEAGLRPDELVWICALCAEPHDRDENSVINIEREGLRLLRERTPGGTGSVRASGGKANGANRLPETNRVSANLPGA